MNIIDSSGWLSYFSDDDNAPFFAQEIENTDRIIVPSITITEVFKRVFHQRGEEAALEVIAQMQQSKVISLNDNLALDAAHYGIKYKLPLTDSIIYATAQKYNAVLWTQDADFEGLENVMYCTKTKSI